MLARTTTALLRVRGFPSASLPTFRCSRPLLLQLFRSNFQLSNQHIMSRSGTSSTKMQDESPFADKRTVSGSASSTAATTCATCRTEPCNCSSSSRGATVDPKLAFRWDQLLITEHKMVRKLFDEIEATDKKVSTTATASASDDKNCGSKRMSLLADLAHALTKHSVEEENVIYPMMASRGLAEKSDHLNKEHVEVKQYLFDLHSMDACSAGWMAKVRAFRRSIEHHMDMEEREYFPALLSKLSEAENQQLSTEMNTQGSQLTTIGDRAQFAYQKAAEGAGYAATQIKEKAGQAAAVIKEKAGQAGGVMHERATAAAAVVKEKAGQAAGVVQEKASQAATAVKSALSSDNNKAMHDDARNPNKVSS